MPVPVFWAGLVSHDKNMSYKTIVSKSICLCTNSFLRRDAKYVDRRCMRAGRLSGQTVNVGVPLVSWFTVAGHERAQWNSFDEDVRLNSEWECAVLILIRDVYGVHSDTTVERLVERLIVWLFLENFLNGTLSMKARPG